MLDERIFRHRLGHPFSKPFHWDKVLSVDKVLLKSHLDTFLYYKDYAWLPQLHSCWYSWFVYDNLSLKPLSRVYFDVFIIY